MIYQTAEGISKLAEDTGVLLVAPALFLCFGLGNAMLPQNRKDSGFRTRLVLTLALLFMCVRILSAVHGHDPNARNLIPAEQPTA